jgi:hypothetical protein
MMAGETTAHETPAQREIRLASNETPAQTEFRLGLMQDWTGLLGHYERRWQTICPEGAVAAADEEELEYLSQRMLQVSRMLPSHHPLGHM